jgi:hypothetical protein
MTPTKEAHRELHILTLFRISNDGKECTEEQIGAYGDEQTAMNISNQQAWDGHQQCFFRMESYGLGMVRRVLTRPVGFDWWT